MLRTLSPQQLTININVQDLGFADTSELINREATSNSPAWIGQTEAEKAAKFGLNMQQSGFHLLVLGEQGSDRTSLMLREMQVIASQRPESADLVLLHHFESPEKPLPVYVKPGRGAALRTEMDAYIRYLVKTLPSLFSANIVDASLADANPSDSNLADSNPVDEGALDVVKDDVLADKAISEVIKNAASQLIDLKLATFKQLADETVLELEKFTTYLAALKQDTLENIEVFQQVADNEGVLEGFLSRYRINLLVDNRHIQGAPVIYDDDPSFQSLFGGYESSSESHNSAADFMRLRSGNLLRAHGGMLMLHLRDIQADQQNGSQILEKLHRVLRNARVQMEESGGASGQSSASHFAPEALPVEVKVVLIATREEYYALQNDLPDFAKYFRIKVDFTERFDANNQNYQAIGQYIAALCEQARLKHFSAAAVVRLIKVMQRAIDDQKRISTTFSQLQSLVLESATVATMRETTLVELQDVEQAIAAKQARHNSPEQQLRESIIDGELMISVQGHEVGQINGLTHIDLGDAFFGSPVRISARCFAGDDGVINIDREVEMTGPNHDKGLFIMRSWLSANFVGLTPLSLTASLVFEQEYHGVEGDSASCAELYALLSALSGLGLPQGIAITGALNQHGEVMPIGGVNEKIEGFFRLCKAIGLDGSQGVIIPGRNQSHLLLDDEVIDAVAQGKFHIYTIDHVFEGISLLTGASADDKDADGQYQAETIMGRVQQTLATYRKAYENNRFNALASKR